MSVYYLDNNNTFEVVLTYDVDSDPYQPERIRVNLDNGEEARLSLPGQPQVVYAVSREDDRLRVEAMPFVQGFASATQ